MLVGCTTIVAVARAAPGRDGQDTAEGRSCYARNNGRAPMLVCIGLW